MMRLKSLRAIHTKNFMAASPQLISGLERMSPSFLSRRQIGAMRTGWPSIVRTMKSLDTC
jgi:hypothetical protein